MRISTGEGYHYGLQSYQWFNVALYWPGFPYVCMQSWCRKMRRLNMAWWPILQIYRNSASVSLATFLSNKCSSVRWDGGISAYFRVTRGTKQGNILSPVLFNIFINDLLQELTSSDLGIKIGSSTFNNFAYADDVSLLSLCCQYLQLLIDLCESYVKRWRFSFGTYKTKCMVAGRIPFKSSPRWNLGGKLIQNLEEIEILGRVFWVQICHLPVIPACRKAMCSSLHVSCRAILWCQPIPLEIVAIV